MSRYLYRYSLEFNTVVLLFVLFLPLTLYLQDVVYREMKLLRASVRNSQKIDKTFERVFNILFYIFIAVIILYVFRLDPVSIFLSLSSIVLAFSFMISTASSKYVEGLMFILYRRPYDIGVSSLI